LPPSSAIIVWQIRANLTPMGANKPKAA